MRKNNGTKIKLLRGEKIICFLIIITIIATPIMLVFSKAILSQTNIEVEQIKNKVETQASLNESLNMKINELASLDKIQEVAKEQGLSYNNDNIKVIVE